MPQATNLVVKNATNVDTTFTLLTPAAGYGGIAEWANKVGATSTVYPSFTMAATKTQSRSRKVTVKVNVPASYTSVTTGLPVVSSTMVFHGTLTVPDDYPDNQKDDAVAYLANLLGTTLVKACLRDALPAT